MKMSGVLSALCLAGLLLCGTTTGDPQPETLEQLQDFYPKVADNVNGALVYLKAMEARVIGEYNDDLPILGGMSSPEIPAAPLDAKVKAGLSAELEANAETLRILYQAGAMPQCRYPIDLTQGQALEFPHLSRLRDCCRLLWAQAVTAADDQHAGLAVQSVLDMAAMGQSLGNGPVMLSQLLRRGCWDLAIDAMEQVVNRVPLEDNALLQFQEILAKADDRNAIVRALQGELCVCKNTETETRKQRMARSKAAVEYIRKRRAREEEEELRELEQKSHDTCGNVEKDCSIEKDGFQHAPPGLPPEFTVCKMLRKEKSETIKRIYTALHAMERSYFEGLKLFPPLIDPMKMTPEQYYKKHIDPGNGHSPSYQNMILGAARLAAKAAAAQGCIAFERYRLKNGKLPDKWEDLAPGILPAPIQDPFTKDSPLLFRVKDNGYVVYSVGDNGKDDGGEKGDGPKPLDLCFRKMDMLKEPLTELRDRGL